MHNGPCQKWRGFSFFPAMETKDPTNIVPENEIAKQMVPTSDAITEVLVDSHDEHHEEHHDDLHPVEDFSGLNKAQLLAKMVDAATHAEPEQVRGTVQQLKETFRELVREEMEARRRTWEATKEEGDIFEPAPDHEAERFEELVRNYNRNRAEIRRRRDQEQNRNLVAKLGLVEELKTLAESSESMQKAFEKLQDIQNRWRAIGQVPSAQAQELWKNWQHHQNRFFDVVKISRELRELDMKKNQELKEELIHKASELAEEPSVRRALDRLHQLHEQWKEIGPAPKDTNELLWERFKASSDAVHTRKEAMLLDARKEQEENLKLKEALIVRLKLEADQTYDSYKGWQSGGAKIDAIFEEWRKIGFVPKANEKSLWQSFYETRKQFYNKREAFFAVQREEFKSHLNDKIRLCEQAEKLSTSTDWKGTANAYKRLLDEWKKTGPLPRKQADKIWARFKAASDTFFQARNNQFAAADAELKANSVARENLIAEAAAVELPEDINEAKKLVHGLQQRWSESSDVPRNERQQLEEKWKAALDKLYNSLREKAGGDNSSIQRMRYEQLQQTEKGREQIFRERTGLQEKIKRLEHEINTLETNLGFFSKSKGAASLVGDYQKKADEAREEVTRLKAQLKLLPRD